MSGRLGMLYRPSGLALETAQYVLDVESVQVKYDIKDMQRIARERGGDCLSEKYINNTTKIHWRCIKGHEWSSTPKNVKKGHWCPYCGNSVKLTIEEMQRIAKSRGGICLSKEYFGIKIRLRWQCSRGHKWEATPDNIKRGKWCPYCAGQHQTIKDMQEIAKKHGGECTSKEYVDNRTKLQWRCEKGHKWEAVPGHIKEGSWCPYCCGNIKLTIEDMQRLARYHNGECLSSDYINAMTKLMWRCKEGHEWEANANNIKNGKWCPYCSQGRSERFCREIFVSLFNTPFPTMKPRWLVNPKTNRRLELDGYCKKIGIAFEYQGKQHYKPIYSNKKVFENRQQLDELKRIICHNKGIILIEVPFFIGCEEMQEYIIGECEKKSISIPSFERGEYAK